MANQNNNKPELTWVNFLHIYQPPNQFPEVLDKVVNESYLPLIKLAKKYPRFYFTLNINASLTEQLAERGYKNAIKDLSSLARRRQIEFTGSAAYHPILPLLPEGEIYHQIEKNYEINRKYFGSVYKPTGFFSPEMAYSNRLAKAVKKLGYKWIIQDENQVDERIIPSKKYLIKGLGLEVIFRERRLSKSYPPEVLGKRLDEAEAGEVIGISATDGEIYGHWHKDERRVLQKLIVKPRVNILRVSDFLFERRGRELVTPFRSSWESLPEEISSGIPFRLWNDPKNKLHQKLWGLAKLAIKIINENKKDPNYYWARWHLDRGLASCTFWWCSHMRPSPFCPITWNPDEVEKGLMQLIRSIRSLEKLPTKTKLGAEKKYFQLQKLIWETHWKEYGTR
jgi:predicted glycosyl hydrolase (DUF1957 family)